MLIFGTFLVFSAFILACVGYSDEGGQQFRFRPGHQFGADAGHDRSEATLADGS
jgi:hypothetical protein